jgi:hypothetical protein
MNPQREFGVESMLTLVVPPLITYLSPLFPVPPFPVAQAVEPSELTTPRILFATKPSVKAVELWIVPEELTNPIARDNAAEATEAVPVAAEYPGTTR